jgi:hypothetical protein
VLGKGSNFSSDSTISIGDASVAEFNIIIFFAGNGDLVVTCTDFSLQIEQDGLKILGSEGLGILLSEKNHSVIVTSLKVALSSCVILLLSSRLIL